MPHIDAYLFKKKGVKRQLTLVLDEDDSILECIKQGMQEQGLTDVTVEGMDGVIKEGLGSYMDGSQFITKKFANDEVFNASGKYKLQVNQLWGNLRVIVNVKNPLHVTLSKGKAAQGLKINLSYIELVDSQTQVQV